MELLKNIRLKIGYSILKKNMEKTKRKVFYSNFSKIKKIGITWDASNISDFSCLSRFYKKLHDKNIEVIVLGYFPGKELPDQYTAVRYFNCLRRKQLSFFYIPSTPEANSFINTRFDVLIDVNFNKIFALNYLMFLSLAAFKVGLSGPESIDSPYDLMIDSKSSLTTENYLDEVIHYLEMIDSGESV